MPISRSGEVAALVISLSTGLSTRTVRHSLGDFGSPFSFFSPTTNHFSPLTAALAVPSYWINHCLTHVAHAVTPEMLNQLCFYLPKNPFTEYRRAYWRRPTDIDLQTTGAWMLPK